MPSYYETLDGFKLDKGLIEAVRVAVKGQGDGRVSVEDAKEVYKKAADAGKVTRVERWTLRYCMTEFKWTDAAEDYIVEELKNVPQEDEDEQNPAEPKEPEPKKHKAEAYYETIDGVRCDKALIDAVREAVKGKGDGRVSIDDAKEVYKKAADGGKVTRVERWSLRYCITEFKWTEAAEDYIFEELKKVPQEDDDGVYSDPEKKMPEGRCTIC